MNDLAATLAALRHDAATASYSDTTAAVDSLALDSLPLSVLRAAGKTLSRPAHEMTRKATAVACLRRYVLDVSAMISFTN